MTPQSIRPASLRGMRTRWPLLGLGAILVLAAALGFVNLDREGYSNPYYAAAVRSMLTGWQAFFFASYDAAGFVSVDKPPVGLWIQALSAGVLGYRGWTLLLPQVLAHVAAVALLYHLVARRFGPVAGLLAALVLALTPISVATARNNTMDSLLVLALLLAAWAASIAAERGRLSWLVIAMALVGIGFNIKMLQAYLVLPAVVAVYLVAAALTWKRRLWHVAAAGVVLVAVSLSWGVLVDLTPSGQRPYVGGSRSNSVLELAIGYNGLDRLTGLFGGVTQAPGGDGPGNFQPAPGATLLPMPSGVPSGPGGGAVAPGPGGGGGTVLPGPGGGGGTTVAGIGGELGAPGPLRLFGPELAGQISWVLPFALVGLVPAALRTRPWRLPMEPPAQQLLLWGAWLLAAGTVFSIASFWHPYYLVVLAPAVAALSGIGLVALWRDYREADGPRAWLLPAALAITAALQWLFLTAHPDWAALVGPWVAAGSGVAAVTLILARVRTGSTGRASHFAKAAVVIGLAAVLVAPATWSVITVMSAPGDMLPIAGPRLGELPGMPGTGFGTTDPMGELDHDLLTYLVERRGEADFLFATPSSSSASPYIIATGLPVMAMGGFGGADPILSPAQVAEMVARGEVRFFLLDDLEAFRTPGGPAALPEIPGGDAAGWVRDNCAVVSAEEIGERETDLRSAMPMLLFDCAREG